MRRTVLPYLILVSLVAIPGIAEAQAAPIVVGSAVRLQLLGEPSPVEGIMASNEAGTWTLSQADGTVRTLVAGDILEASVRQTRTNAVRGGLIGGGLGLILGLIAVGSDDDCDRDPTPFCDAVVDTVETAALLVLPVAGGGIGALVGLMIESERWVPGALAAGPGRGATAVTLAWRLPAGW